MLRVWGGGIWEPRAWFDACDEFGVMLYLLRGICIVLLNKSHNLHLFLGLNYAYTFPGVDTWICSLLGGALMYRVRHQRQCGRS